jgi:hypothetical protein
MHCGAPARASSWQCAIQDLCAGQAGTLNLVGDRDLCQLSGVDTLLQCGVIAGAYLDKSLQVACAPVAWISCEETALVHPKQYVERRRKRK